MLKKLFKVIWVVKEYKEEEKRLKKRASKNYQAGSLVAPGYQLCEVGDSNQLLVIFFVSEKHLNLFPYGASVSVSAGSYEASGKVVYVDINSQFTPREYQNGRQSE